MTRPAMGDERRWAARYQFLEQLWRGRDRLVCDRELEAAIHTGAEGQLAELLDHLIPKHEGEGRAWVALHNDRRAASFARSRAGTVFVSLDDAVELASDEDWQVALVNLDDGATELLDALEPLFDVLSERCEDDEARSVVLTLAVGADEDETFEQLAEVVEMLFDNARIYGLARPTMAAFYDFGLVLEPDAGEPGEGESEPAAGVEVDTTLGNEAPRFELFVAVVGSTLPGEGVTFVELPARADGHTSAGAAASDEAEELAALRLQLAEAQRRGDMQAIERQALLERLEHAEDRLATLDEELDSRHEGGESGASLAGATHRLDEALAREQSLRWELERLRGEVEHLRVRPIEALEAELAGVAAQLELTEAALAELEDAAALADEDDAAAGAHDFAHDGRERLGAADEPSQAQARAWLQARGQLEHLLRKLERGGALSALELHRELSALRKLL